MSRKGRKQQKENAVRAREGRRLKRLGLVTVNGVPQLPADANATPSNSIGWVTGSSSFSSASLLQREHVREEITLFSSSGGADEECDDIKVEVKEENDGESRNDDIKSGCKGEDGKESYQSCHCVFCFKAFKPTSLQAPSGFDADFMAMFVLKKLLEIPRNNLEEYLKLGDHPRNWIFFCGACKPVVLKAFTMQRSILELETRLRSVQDDIRRRIRASFDTRYKTANNRASSASVVTTEVRRFVATGDYEDNRNATFAGCSKRKPVKHMVVPTIYPNETIDPLSTELQPDSPETPDFDVAGTSSCENNMIRSNTGFPLPSTMHTSSTAECSKRSLAKKLAATARQCYAMSDPDPQPSWPETPDFDPPKSDSFYDENSDCSDDNNGSASGSDSVECNTSKVRTIRRQETAFRRCALCPKVEPMESHSFVRHVLYHYDRPYKCLECGAFVTGSQQELDKYPKGVIRRSRETDPSHVCSLLSVSKVEYQIKKIWKCAHCEEKYDTMEERDVHENTGHHNRSLSVKLKCKCSSCSKEFRSKAEWRVHRALNHPEIAKFSCDYCDEIFKLKSKEGIDVLDFKKLRLHEKQGHDVQFDRIIAPECDFCGANFKNTALLKQHTEHEHAVGSSATVNLFSCPICHARFNIRRNQQKHLLNVHFSSQKKPWICDVCGYSALPITLFREHQFIMHSILPGKEISILKCSAENCSYQCLLRSSLKLHMMKKHGKERQLKCDICGKGFMKHQQLKGHREIHANATLKPFQCEICGNSFAVKNYLYIHMRLSHQNRPFASTHKKKPARHRRRQPVNHTALLQDKSAAPAASMDSCATLDPQTQVVSLGTSAIAVGNQALAPMDCQPSNSTISTVLRS